MKEGIAVEIRQRKLGLSIAILLAVLAIMLLRTGNGLNSVNGQVVHPGPIMESMWVDCISRFTPEGICCLDHFSVVTTEQHCLESEGTWYAGHGVNQPTPCPSPCHADISGDGVVNTTDFTLLMDGWGWCPDYRQHPE